MRRIIFLLHIVFTTYSYPLHNSPPYFYTLNYLSLPPYPDFNYGYKYAPQLPTYNPYIPSYANGNTQDFIATGYSSTIPEAAPTLNVLAELPYAVSNDFSVVPMFIVSKNTMKMVNQGHITSISKEEPIMTVKISSNSSVHCTPAVRMVLDKPVLVDSLESNILFPSEVQIVHEGVKIPIKIGAVIAPVLPQTYVSQETPISVKVVYAIPTKPIKITITIESEEGISQNPPSSQQPEIAPPLNQRFPDLPDTDKKPQGTGNTEKVPEKNQSSQDQSSQVHIPSSIPPAAETILQNQGATGQNGSHVYGALSNKPDYVNNVDAAVVHEQEAVVVERGEDLPPKNITVLEFPKQEAEPHFQVDEEDEELVNRNPPLVLAPAGIVQSTQPESHVEQFHNDKESPYLEVLREQAKKKKL